MADPLFEQRQIRTSGPWIMGAVSLACLAWVASQWDAVRGDVLVMAGLVAMASVPFLFLGLPMLLKRHHVLVVDQEGLWIDGELAVVADRISAVGKLARHPHLPTDVLDGALFYRYRLQDVGDALVLPSDRLRGRPYGGLTEVVVAARPRRTDAWDGPPGVLTARCVHTREPEALLEALVACAPAVEAASTILVPEYTQGFSHTSTPRFTGRYHHPVTRELIVPDGGDEPDDANDPAWPTAEATPEDQ